MIYDAAIIDEEILNKIQTNKLHLLKLKHFDQLFEENKTKHMGV
jgi:hypothetical protein